MRRIIFSVKIFLTYDGIEVIFPHNKTNPENLPAIKKALEMMLLQTENGIKNDAKSGFEGIDLPEGVERI